MDLRIITNIERFKSKLKHYLFTDFRSYLRMVDPYTTVGITHNGEDADDGFLLNYLFY